MVIRLLTDLGTDAPYGSSLRISRTVRYHSVGATRQGSPSPGRPESKKQTRSQGDCGSAFYDRTESLFLRPCAQAFHLRTCRTVVVAVSLRTYLPVQQPVYSHQFHQWHPGSEHREQELHQPSSTSEEPHCAQWERGHHP